MGSTVAPGGGLERHARREVSLAVALALLLTTGTGGSFPEGSLIMALTFAVIFLHPPRTGAVPPGLRSTASDSTTPTARSGGDTDPTGRDQGHSRRSTRSRVRSGHPNEAVERMRNRYQERNRLAARAGKIEADGYEDW